MVSRKTDGVEVNCYVQLFLKVCWIDVWILVMSPKWVHKYLQKVAKDVFSCEKPCINYLILLRKNILHWLKMKLIKTILKNCTGKFCYRQGHFQIWKLIYVTAVYSCLIEIYPDNIWEISPEAHLHRSATFVKLQIEVEQFTKIVLHHECFSEMSRKFSDQQFGLSIRSCPCTGRNVFEIYHSAEFL